MVCRVLVLPTARFFMAEAGTMSGLSGAPGSTEMDDDNALRAMHLRPFFDANVRCANLLLDLLARHVTRDGGPGVAAGSQRPEARPRGLSLEVEH